MIQIILFFGSSFFSGTSALAGAGFVLRFMIIAALQIAAEMGEGRGVDGAFHLLIGYMGIDFRGTDVGMAKYFLQDTDVNAAVLEHQSGGSMTKLMGGKSLTV